MVETGEASIKNAVIEFSKSHYAKHGKVPSVRTIQKKFKGVRFYVVFRKGMRQLCREAGLPVPESRLKAVSRAFKARSETRVKSHVEHIRRLEAVVDRLLEEVFQLQTNLACIEWPIKGGGMEDFVECVEQDAYNLMRWLVEADPERARKLLEYNPFLEYASATYLDWSCDDEWLEKNYPKGLNWRRKWAKLLREHCPESEYLKT